MDNTNPTQPNPIPVQPTMPPVMAQQPAPTSATFNAVQPPMREAGTSPLVYLAIIVVAALVAGGAYYWFVPSTTSTSSTKSVTPKVSPTTTPIPVTPTPSISELEQLNQVTIPTTDDDIQSLQGDVKSL